MSTDDPAYIAELEARCERFAQAFLKVLPSHHQKVLFFHYTIDRPGVYQKFWDWIASEKNTVGPYDPERWFKVFGLEEGDLVKRDASDKEVV